jgi:hypothetical protein
VSAKGTSTQTTHYTRALVFGYDDERTACGEPLEVGAQLGRPARKARLALRAGASCETCREIFRTAKVRVGAKVFAIDGPGQCEKTGARHGEITKIEVGRFGTTATVRFEDGSEEGFSFHSIREEVCGIGIYVAKEQG